MHLNKKTKTEWGDFQTPLWFASQVCHLLAAKGIAPASILEPTCGLGNFIQASLNQFNTITQVFGADINLSYATKLRDNLTTHQAKANIEIAQANFFHTDWQKILNKLADPLLIIENPPWVTNSELTTLDSHNLPPKKNFHHRSGIEAITGMSNFDISEWMLLPIFDWAAKRPSVIAILCKTAVARKVLLYTWKNVQQPGSAAIHLFDTQKVFNAAVDACLLIYDTRTTSAFKSCRIYGDLTLDSSLNEIGFSDQQLVANIEFYQKWRHLDCQNKTTPYQWRSGIKHDCAKVMELKQINGRYLNQLGEVYELESQYLYPMLKSSDINKISETTTSRWMLVTQEAVGNNTLTISQNAPQTWAYLRAHGKLLDQRKSMIYHNQPRFSIFGVGDYSFAPWKVAISGLYKQLVFTIVGPYQEKPTVLDDTCYFLPCQNKEEAKLLAELLNSKPAQEFYRSLIFWDAKRPVTANILRRLNLLALASEQKQQQQLEDFIEMANHASGRQLNLF